MLCYHFIFPRDNIYLYKGKIDQLDSIYINGVLTYNNILLGYCSNRSGTRHYEVEGHEYSNDSIQIYFKSTRTGKGFFVKGSIDSATQNIILDSPTNILVRIKGTDFPYAKFKCPCLTSSLVMTSETVTGNAMKECNYSTYDTISFCPYFELVAENQCTFTEKERSKCQITIQSHELTKHYSNVIKQISGQKADSIIGTRRSFYSIALVTTNYICYCITSTYPLQQFSWHRAMYYAIPVYELK